MASEFLLRLGQLTAVASAAATVALALRPLVRRVLGSRLAYGLWVLVPLSVAAWVLPAPVAFADPIGWPTPVPARVSEARKVVTPEVDEPVTAPLADDSVSLVDRELVARGLSLLWLLGVLAGIGLIVVRHRRALAALGELVPTERDDVFRSSRSAIGPGLYGLIRPRIVVPSDFETLFDTQQQQLIIAHERAHRRHGDTRTNAIATFGVALTWFNPIGYIALRAFRHDQELARDASVMDAFPGSAATYGRAMALLAPTTVPYSALVCSWPRSHPLVERVRLLSKGPPSPATRGIGVLALVALSAGTTALSWAGQPPRVQFRPAAVELAQSARRFEARALAVQATGRFDFVVQDRSDVALSAGMGAVRMEGDVLTLNDGLDACAERPENSDAELPADRTIYLPRDFELRLGGAVQARITGEYAGRLELGDCSAAVVESTGAALDVNVSDSASLELIHAKGPVDAILVDQSRMITRRADSGLRLDQLGASESQTGQVSGTVRMALVGASTGSLDRLDCDAMELTVVGASEASIDAGRIDTLDLRVLGASTANFAARVGSARVAASGAAHVRIDQASAYRIASRPSSNGTLQINGTDPPR